MAAADAGGNPTRLSATPARVRAQCQMKEKTKILELELIQSHMAQKTVLRGEVGKPEKENLRFDD